MPKPTSSMRSVQISMESAQILPMALQNCTVVIVDDQEVARFALDEMIRAIDGGIETLLFASATDALTWLERHDADLVITDFRMPDLSGAQLTTRIRQSNRLRHIPVMMVTAADERSVRYEALDAGAVDFLTKPIDPLEVRTRCRNLLLLAQQYRLAKNYAVLQEQKLHQLRKLLEALVPTGTQNLAKRIERGELITLKYDELFAITSCVAGVQELVSAAQEKINALEATLIRPLRSHNA